MPVSFNRFSTVFSSGGICMRASLVMNEVMGGTEELQVECRLMSDDRLRFGLRLQSLFPDALEAVDVEQFEVESPSAGSVQTSGAVAFGQAQQLLRLTQTAPGELAAQKLIGEITGGGSQFTGPLAVVVGPAQGVGSPALWVIRVIGGAAAGWLALMGLDQLAVQIDMNQRSIAADLDAAARSSAWEPSRAPGQSGYDGPDEPCIEPRSASRSARPGAGSAGASLLPRRPPGALAGWFRGCGGPRPRGTRPERGAPRGRDR